MPKTLIPSASAPAAELTSAAIRARIGDLDARIAMRESKKADVERELSFRRGGVLLGTSDADVTRLEAEHAAIVDELGKLAAQRADLEPWEAVATHRDLCAERDARLAERATRQARHDAKIIELPARRKAHEAEGKAIFAEEIADEQDRRWLVTVSVAGMDARIAQHAETHRDVLRAAGVI